MDLFEVTLVAIGLSAALLLWRLLRPPGHFIIGKRGILDRDLGLGWILWDEIEGAYRTHHGDAVCLRVRVSDRLAPRLRRSGHATVAHGSVEIPLALEGSSISEVQVLQEILRHGCNA